MLIARWRSLSSLKISSILELSSSSTTHFAPFHSTSILSENSSKKFGSSGKVSEGKRASKNSIRFTCTVKEKRSDAKKALHNLLFHTKGSRDFLQKEWHFGEPNREIRDRHVKKKSPPGRGKKLRDKKTKRWHRDGSLDGEFDTETTFADRKSQSHKAYSYSKDSKSGFEWRQGFSWTNQSQRSKNWGDVSSCDEEPLIVESRSQRTVLGLRPIGPLKISDVKNAFRSAALKWHPDKHQGPCQEAAQEKFKLCLDAYKSLCSSLS
ncbi:unnamed protein product [Arabidopsis arenosa]|uniref:J domain-containing protein n=1 Tax=Arabidopsis arenosa TaxID=38785 RepID=A0A8S2BBH9_ARAAE|nr:unnamed protein product [Arabidopsis arenosa]